MTALPQRYIGLLTLRGDTQRAHESYINAMAALGRFYRRPPDSLSDDEVRSYLLGLHRRGLSRSTITIAISAMRLLFGTRLKPPVERIKDCLPRPRQELLRAQVYSCPNTS